MYDLLGLLILTSSEKFSFSFLRSWSWNLTISISHIIFLLISNIKIEHHNLDMIYDLINFLRLFSNIEISNLRLFTTQSCSPTSCGSSHGKSLIEQIIFIFLFLFYFEFTKAERIEKLVRFRCPLIFTFFWIRAMHVKRFVKV